MKKVSVIVPVYNTEQYLRRCLDALVNQTLEDIEIIVVNDGSTDYSIDILREYEESNPSKIKVLTKENGGQASARNMGICCCTGEYIGFADSDDYVDTSMYEKMYFLAKQKDADLVECHYHYLQENEGKLIELKTRGNIREYKNQKDMFIDPQVSPWNKLYRREVLVESGITFPEGLIYEDTSFYIKTISMIKKTAYLDEHLVYYFMRGNSTMNANKSKKVADIFAVLQDILDYYKGCQLYEVYANELEYFCVKILLCSSLSRIGRVVDKNLQNQLLDKTFEIIYENFPKYKENPYFTGKIGIYIRMMNRILSKPVGRLLGKIMKG